jgi:hypothetical protein
MPNFPQSVVVCDSNSTKITYKVTIRLRLPPNRDAKLLDMAYAHNHPSFTGAIEAPKNAVNAFGMQKQLHGLLTREHCNPDYWMSSLKLPCFLGCILQEILSLSDQNNPITRQSN